MADDSTKDLEEEQARNYAANIANMAIRSMRGASLTDCWVKFTVVIAQEIERAKREEREACAKVADGFDVVGEPRPAVAYSIATAIRARGLASSILHVKVGPTGNAVRCEPGDPDRAGHLCPIPSPESECANCHHIPHEGRQCGPQPPHGIPCGCFDIGRVAAASPG